MVKLDIPGFGFLELEHFVTDFSGTLSEDGKVLPGVIEKLNELSEKLKIHVLTSDTFGRAQQELKGVNCTLQILEGERHIFQKEQYVLDLGAEKVVALGNGNNDARMLKKAGVGIVVCLKEGCSVNALQASTIFIKSPIDAIDLLLKPKRLIATLRV
ncbi:MAG: ATPase P [Nitrospira sp.]|nr:ATPase P [Nitrospira sp.]